jgi:hypothetical protein
MIPDDACVFSEEGTSMYRTSLTSNENGRTTTNLSLVSVVDSHHLDADPDSTHHPDADLDSDFYLMQIRIRLFTLRIRI